MKNNKSQGLKFLLFSGIKMSKFLIFFANFILLVNFTWTAAFSYMNVACYSSKPPKIEYYGECEDNDDKGNAWTYVYWISDQKTQPTADNFDEIFPYHMEESFGDHSSEVINVGSTIGDQPGRVCYRGKTTKPFRDAFSSKDLSQMTGKICGVCVPIEWDVSCPFSVTAVMACVWGNFSGISKECVWCNGKVASYRLEYDTSKRAYIEDKLEENKDEYCKDLGSGNWLCIISLGTAVANPSEFEGFYTSYGKCSAACGASSQCDDVSPGSFVDNNKVYCDSECNAHVCNEGSKCSTEVSGYVCVNDGSNWKWISKSENKDNADYGDQCEALCTNWNNRLVPYIARQNRAWLALEGKCVDNWEVDYVICTKDEEALKPCYLTTSSRLQSIYVWDSNGVSKGELRSHGAAPCDDKPRVKEGYVVQITIGSNYKYNYTCKCSGGTCHWVALPQVSLQARVVSSKSEVENCDAGYACAYIGTDDGLLYLNATPSITPAKDIGAENYTYECRFEDAKGNDLSALDTNPSDGMISVKRGWVTLPVNVICTVKGPRDYWDAVNKDTNYQLLTIKVSFDSSSLNDAGKDCFNSTDCFSYCDRNVTSISGGVATISSGQCADPDAGYNSGTYKVGSTCEAGLAFDYLSTLTGGDLSGFSSSESNQLLAAASMLSEWAQPPSSCEFKCAWELAYNITKINVDGETLKWNISDIPSDWFKCDDSNEQNWCRDCCLAPITGELNCNTQEFNKRLIDVLACYYSSCEDLSKLWSDDYAKIPSEGILNWPVVKEEARKVKDLAGNVVSFFCGTEKVTGVDIYSTSLTCKSYCGSQGCGGSTAGSALCTMWCNPRGDIHVNFTTSLGATTEEIIEKGLLDPSLGTEANPLKICNAYRVCFIFNEEPPLGGITIKLLDSSNYDTFLIETEKVNEIYLSEDDFYITWKYTGSSIDYKFIACTSQGRPIFLVPSAYKLLPLNNFGIPPSQEDTSYAKQLLDLDVSLDMDLDGSEDYSYTFKVNVTPANFSTLKDESDNPWYGWCPIGTYCIEDHDCKDEFIPGQENKYLPYCSVLGICVDGDYVGGAYQIFADWNLTRLREKVENYSYINSYYRSAETTSSGLARYQELGCYPGVCVMQLKPNALNFLAIGWVLPEEEAPDITKNFGKPFNLTIKSLTGKGFFVVPDSELTEYWSPYIKEVEGSGQYPTGFDLLGTKTGFNYSFLELLDGDDNGKIIAFVPTSDFISELQKDNKYGFGAILLFELQNKTGKKLISGIFVALAGESDYEKSLPNYVEQTFSGYENVEHLAYNKGFCYRDDKEKTLDYCGRIKSNVVPYCYAINDKNWELVIEASQEFPREFESWFPYSPANYMAEGFGYTGVCIDSCIGEPGKVSYCDPWENASFCADCCTEFGFSFYPELGTCYAACGTEENAISLDCDSVKVGDSPKDRSGICNLKCQYVEDPVPLLEFREVNGLNLTPIECELEEGAKIVCRFKALINASSEIRELSLKPVIPTNFLPEDVCTSKIGDTSLSKLCSLWVKEGFEWEEIPYSRINAFTFNISFDEFKDLSTESFTYELKTNNHVKTELIFEITPGFAVEAFNLSLPDCVYRKGVNGDRCVPASEASVFTKVRLAGIGLENGAKNVTISCELASRHFEGEVSQSCIAGDCNWWIGRLKIPSEFFEGISTGVKKIECEVESPYVHIANVSKYLGIFGEISNFKLSVPPVIFAGEDAELEVVDVRGDMGEALQSYSTSWTIKQETAGVTKMQEICTGINICPIPEWLEEGKAELCARVSASYYEPLEKCVEVQVYRPKKLKVQLIPSIKYLSLKGGNVTFSLLITNTATEEMNVTLKAIPGDVKLYIPEGTFTIGGDESKLTFITVEAPPVNEETQYVFTILVNNATVKGKVVLTEKPVYEFDLSTYELNLTLVRDRVEGKITVTNVGTVEDDYIVSSKEFKVEPREIHLKDGESAEIKVVADSEASGKVCIKSVARPENEKCVSISVKKVDVGVDIYFGNTTIMKGQEITIKLAGREYEGTYLIELDSNMSIERTEIRRKLYRGRNVTMLIDYKVDEPGAYYLRVRACPKEYSDICTEKEAVYVVRFSAPEEVEVLMRSLNRSLEELRDYRLKSYVEKELVEIGELVEKGRFEDAKEQLNQLKAMVEEKLQLQRYASIARSIKPKKNLAPAFIGVLLIAVGVYLSFFAR